LEIVPVLEALFDAYDDLGIPDQAVQDPRPGKEERIMKAYSQAVGLLCCTLVTFATTSAGRGADMEAPAPRARAEVEAVLAKAPQPPAESQLRPLHIVLLADVKDHGPGAHDYPLWQERWARLIGGRQAAGDSVKQVNLFGPPEGDPKETVAGAAKVKVTTAWQWPSKEQLESADLIVMQCYRSGGAKRTWSDARIAELDAYLSGEGGFVVIHPATYTLRDLSQPGGDRMAALTGLAFDKSIIVRHGPIKLKITARDHPICLGLPETIDLIDEPYWPPVGDRNEVTVLATSDERVPKGSDNVRPQPMFWTARYGPGRIFGCVPGHFTWTFDDPYFRILLLRGMAWAAGESPYRFDTLVTRGVPLR
jgi:type 1 glutamine amidotransferase